MILYSLLFYSFKESYGLLVHRLHDYEAERETASPVYRRSGSARFRRSRRLSGGCAERRQQSQDSRRQRWHCPQHRYHLLSAPRSSIRRAASQAPWGCKGLSPHSSNSSSRSSCSQCTPAANTQGKAKRARAHPSATAGCPKHCLQREMTIFSCSPNCLTSLLPVLLADSQVADALILP